MTSLAVRYVRLRAEGKGSREAAREAGYAHGVPSTKALCLWRAYRTIEGHSKEELSHIPKRLKELQEKAEELAYLRQAMELL